MRGDVGDVSERDALLGLRGGGARRLGPPGALGHGGALGGGGGGAAGGGDGRHRDGGKRRPLPESPSSGWARVGRKRPDRSSEGEEDDGGAEKGSNGGVSGYFMERPLYFQLFPFFTAAG